MFNLDLIYHSLARNSSKFLNTNTKFGLLFNYRKKIKIKIKKSYKRRQPTLQWWCCHFSLLGLLFTLATFQILQLGCVTIVVSLLFSFDSLWCTCFDFFLFFFLKSSKVELFLHFSIIFETFSLVVKFAKLFRKSASWNFETQVQCGTWFSKNRFAIGGDLTWKRLTYCLNFAKLN